jgi:undecaprenyl diphosphate synthase
VSPTAASVASLAAVPDTGPVPRHVAIIMDGNGRWAKARHLPRVAGHKAGVEAVRRVTRAARAMGVEALTLYAFSSENWRRPEDEVRFAPDLVALVDDAMAKTAANTGPILVIALNYGSQAELVAATRRLAARAAAGEIDPAAITADDIEAELDTADLPPLDLVIRSSGEQRLSNFLLWQAAYAELLFIDTLWPDFTGDTLADAIAAFGQRQRRYGGL